MKIENMNSRANTNGSRTLLSPTVTLSSQKAVRLTAHPCRYVALLLYPWVDLGAVTRLHPVCS
jgi:hypothetical protein